MGRIFRERKARSIFLRNIVTEFYTLILLIKIEEIKNLR